MDPPGGPQGRPDRAVSGIVGLIRRHLATVIVALAGGVVLQPPILLGAVLASLAMDLVRPGYGRDQVLFRNDLSLDAEPAWTLRQDAAVAVQGGGALLIAACQFVPHPAMLSSFVAAGALVTAAQLGSLCGIRSVTASRQSLRAIQQGLLPMLDVLIIIEAFKGKPRAVLSAGARIGLGALLMAPWIAVLRFTVTGMFPFEMSWIVLALGLFFQIGVGLLCQALATLHWAFDGLTKP
jgi:hypothetical protein